MSISNDDYIELSGELVEEYEAEKIAGEKLSEIKILFIDYHIIKRLMSSCEDKKDYVKKIYAMDKTGVLSDLFTHPSIRRIQYHLSLFDIKKEIIHWIEIKDDNIYENIKKALSGEGQKMLQTKEGKDREDRNAKYLESKSRYGTENKTKISLHSK